jgi:hypothetical protein
MPMPKKRIVAAPPAEAPPTEDDDRTADEQIGGIEEAKARVCNKLQLWADCTRRCRRMHRCTGDPVKCFDGWWRAQSWESKMYFRTYIKARARRGLSAKDAIDVAEAELARMQAEAEQAAAAAETNAAAQSNREGADAAAAKAPTRETPMPRIRVL